MVSAGPEYPMSPMRPGMANLQVSGFGVSMRVQGRKGLFRGLRAQ